MEAKRKKQNIENFSAVGNREKNHPEIEAFY